MPISEITDSLLNAISSPASIVSCDLIYLQVNKVLANIFKVQPEDLINKSVGYSSTGFGKDLYLFYKQLFESDRESGSIVHVREGKTYSIIATKCFYNTAVLSICTDISDLVEYSHKLTEYTHKLEILHDELKDFNKLAAHDLQEPLRKIRINIDKLRTNNSSKIDFTNQSLFLRIESAASRMQDLLNDFLVYSSLENQKELYKEFEAYIIIQEILKDLEALIFSQSAKIVLTSSSKIYGNYKQVKQLLWQLLDNSIKFRKSGDFPIISISCVTSDSNKVCLVIQDNGIGFDNQYSSIIFKPFQRLHAKNGYVGTGMGLAICKKIVSFHEGTIIAKGSVNNGAKFIIELPVRSKENEKK